MLFSLFPSFSLAHSFTCRSISIPSRTPLINSWISPPPSFHRFFFSGSTEVVPSALIPGSGPVWPMCPEVRAGPSPRHRPSPCVVCYRSHSRAPPGTRRFPASPLPPSRPSLTPLSHIAPRQRRSTYDVAFESENCADVVACGFPIHARVCTYLQQLQ